MNEADLNRMMNDMRLMEREMKRMKDQIRQLDINHKRETGNLRTTIQGLTKQVKDLATRRGPFNR